MRLFWEGPRTPNCWRRAEGFQGQQQKWDHFVCKCDWNLISSKGKKTAKKLPPLCSLQNLYLWPSFLSYLFYMCARSNLIPFNYEIVWMNDVIQELYKHEWQEDLPYSQASACNNSDVVRVSVSRLVRWHRSCSEWDSVTLSWIGAICTNCLSN